MLRGLEQRINEVFTEFLVHYPCCRNYRERILGLTLNYMVLNLLNQPEKRLESYFSGQQLKVDITIVLTQIAILLQIPNDERDEESVFEIGPLIYHNDSNKTKEYVTYNKFGGISTIRKANFPKLIYC